ncbi:MAG: preprotein translocase subunit SecG [Thermodesulfobacteriota bacterium]
MNMFTAVIVIHVIASFVLVATVLLQTGKGASIGATFGGAGSQTLFGSAGPATFLAKITIACAVIFMATSMYLTLTSGRKGATSIMSETPAVTGTKEKAPEAVKPGAAEKPVKKALKPAPVEKEKAKAQEKALKPAPVVKETTPAKQPVKAKETSTTEKKK